VARGGNLRHGPRCERHVGGRSWFRDHGQSLWAEFGVAWGEWEGVVSVSEDRRCSFTGRVGRRIGAEAYVCQAGLF
jgi:hypothetical protein